MLKVHIIRDAIKIVYQFSVGFGRIAHLFSRRPFILAFLVVFILTAAQLCPAVETRFDVVPKWVRPGGSITVKLGPDVDSGKKMFLRLSGRATVKDLPLDADQILRRIAELKIPDSMRAGHYETALIGEDGKEFAAPGPRIKIAVSDKATDKPVITDIVPRASYPKHDKYDFDIVGENFGDSGRGLKILINDTHVEFVNPPERTVEMSAADCGDKFPCLLWSWRRLKVSGLSLKDHSFRRPFHVSVEVDGVVSNSKQLNLSSVARSTPIFIAFAVLGALVGVVYLLCRGKAAKYVVNGRSYSVLAYIFIDSETNTYSLSRLQLILWTGAAIVAYVYLAASQFLVQWTWVMPAVPENLPTLIGFSIGTTALAIGATGARGSKGAGPLHPELADFITSGGVFAPERLQFFLWTLIGAFGFVSSTMAQDPATVTTLPPVPESFIPLMGLSSLGYLAGKVARKPGPVIKQLVPPPPYATPVTSISVIGENLSPRAQVILNGVLLETSQVAPAAIPPAGTEFVTELLITLVTPVSTVPGVSLVKVVNPDGQSAEL